MPIKIIQSNDRVAEVQYICDYCGKPIQTRVISKKEADQNQNHLIACWQCKQNRSNQK